jgi:hypothetical protein
VRAKERYSAGRSNVKSPQVGLGHILSSQVRPRWSAAAGQDVELVTCCGMHCSAYSPCCLLPLLILLAKSSMHRSGRCQAVGDAELVDAGGSASGGGSGIEVGAEAADVDGCALNRDLPRQLGGGQRDLPNGRN